jgi:hypothetical protein
MSTHPPPPPRGHVALLTKLSIGGKLHAFVQPSFCPAVSICKLSAIIDVSKSNASGKVAFVILDSRGNYDDIVHINSGVRACAEKDIIAVIIGLPTI